MKKNNITLIIIKENNRRYEEDIKNQLIENITILNEITKLNINDLYIVNYIIDVFDLIPNK